jgi:hypothetical protein
MLNKVTIVTKIQNIYITNEKKNLQESHAVQHPNPEWATNCEQIIVKKNKYKHIFLP